MYAMRDMICMPAAGCWDWRVVAVVECRLFTTYHFPWAVDAESVFVRSLGGSYAYIELFRES